MNLIRLSCVGYPCRARKNSPKTSIQPKRPKHRAPEHRNGQKLDHPELRSGPGIEHSEHQNGRASLPFLLFKSSRKADFLRRFQRLERELEKRLLKGARELVKGASRRGWSLNNPGSGWVAGWGTATRNLSPGLSTFDSPTSLQPVKHHRISRRMMESLGVHWAWLTSGACKLLVPWPASPPCQTRLLMRLRAQTSIRPSRAVLSVDAWENL